MRTIVCAIVTIFAGIALIGQICKDPNSAWSKLSDHELADLSGGTSASWCWPVTVCSRELLSCDGTAGCSHLEVGEVCFTELVFDHPEECNPNLGNETCSSGAKSVEVFCKTENFCRCKINGQQKVCSDRVWKRNVPFTITSDPLVCSFEEFYLETN